MAQNNALNKKSQELTVDPGASGDSFVQFDINATGEFRIGVDDDAADTFKISQGSALGTNDTFVMTSAGERRMPLQPSFLAYLGTTDSDVTGDSTTYTLGSGNALTEIFDQNGDFVTTGTFTAPVDGIYHFFASISYSGLLSTHTSAEFTIRARGGSFYGQGYNQFAIMNNSDTVFSSFDLIVDLDLGDTAALQIRVIGGTKVVDIIGSSTRVQSAFSGFLAC